jgi:hypothetical protein
MAKYLYQFIPENHDHQVDFPIRNQSQLTDLQN